jgi:hypothetical protein
LLHVGNEAALVFALLYHGPQVIPLIAAGLIFELDLVLGREDDPHAPAAASEPPKVEVLAPRQAEPPAASATHTRT